jgi:hypothetical protein
LNTFKIRRLCDFSTTSISRGSNSECHTRGNPYT